MKDEKQSVVRRHPSNRTTAGARQVPRQGSNYQPNKIKEQDSFKQDIHVARGITLLFLFDKNRMYLSSTRDVLK